MQKTTKFRLWLNKLWQEHRSEVYAITNKPVDYDINDYFNKYKWWLKREFKHQTK